MSDTTRRRPDGRLILLLGALAACGPLSIDNLPSLPSLAATSPAAAQSTLTSFMFGFSLGMLLYGPDVRCLRQTPGAARRHRAVCGGEHRLRGGVVDRRARDRALPGARRGRGVSTVRAIARDAHGPTDPARVLSMLSIVTSIGPLLVPLIGGWRVVFIALTLFGIVCAVTAFLRLPETWPKEKRASAAIGKSFAAYGHLLTDPVTWSHMMCRGMAFASMFAYNYCHAVCLNRLFPRQAAVLDGPLFGLNIIGIITGNVLNTKFVGRIGAMKLISAASFVSVAGSLAVALVALTGLGGLWSIIVCLFFVVGVVGLLSANCTTELMHRYPRNAGAAAAVFGAMQLSLGALSSLAVGLFHDVSPHGMEIVIGVCGVLTFAGRTLVLPACGAREGLSAPRYFSGPMVVARNVNAAASACATASGSTPAPCPPSPVS